MPEILKKYTCAQDPVPASKNMASNYGVPCLAWPTYGPLFEYFSKWHEGIDIASPYGTPVYAAYGGSIAYMEKLELEWSYGWHVVIDHGNFYTLYAHLSRIDVEVGDGIGQGDIIGRVGNTGRTTGPHLHFEVLRKETLPKETDPNEPNENSGCPFDKYRRINPLDVLP